MKEGGNGVQAEKIMPFYIAIPKTKYASMYSTSLDFLMQENLKKKKNR